LGICSSRLNPYPASKIGRQSNWNQIRQSSCRFFKAGLSGPAFFIGVFFVVFVVLTAVFGGFERFFGKKACNTGGLNCILPASVKPCRKGVAIIGAGRLAACPAQASGRALPVRYSEPREQPWNLYQLP